MAIIAACVTHGNTNTSYVYNTQRDCQRAVIKCIDIELIGKITTVQNKEKALLKCLQKKEF